jgi:hypothetical protein
MTDQSPRKEAELVEFVRSIDVRAPESLHRQVQALVADRTAGTARSRWLARGRRQRRAADRAARPHGRRLAAVGALAAAAIAVLVIGLSGGGSQTVTLRQASALTVAKATAGAPRESPSHDGELLASVEGVAFPYWKDRFGWRATGMRTDQIAGRTIRTVYYADNGRRIGYAIVAGANGQRVHAGTVVWRGARPYTVSSVDGRTVITWLRHGHLCVVSGRGVDSATLLALASWTDHDTLS